MPQNPADKKDRLIVLLCSVFVFAIFFLALFTPAKELSESERRSLAPFPRADAAAVLSGRWAKQFDAYATDQFPLRDSFRKIKTAVSLYLFRQKDVNGIYYAGAHLSKLEYPMDNASLTRAADQFRRIYEQYLAQSNTRVYVSVIPDKNYFLAEEHGYPAISCEDVSRALLNRTGDFMTCIDIYDCLTLSDYYRTDPHWRQERLIAAADRLASGMGVRLAPASEYTVKALDVPFYGAYCGQAARSVPADTLCYLESDSLSSCVVYDYETGRETGIYDMDLAYGRDPYEMFLSGSKSLMTIKNPAAATDRRLILFRDSFGSSIAPLLSTGYSEIVLIDIRYLESRRLGTLVDFENSDVLFLYSTLVLNNSETLK